MFFLFWELQKCTNISYWIICYYLCTFGTSTSNIGMNVYVYFLFVLIECGHSVILF